MLSRRLTPQRAGVITLWYRPPELLLGATKYGPEVDMWSVGCIFAELVTGKPILPGKNEMEQVELIFRLCGSPSEEAWPGCSKLPWFHMFKPDRPHRRRLLEHLSRAPADVQELCDKLLTLDPAARLGAEQALLQDYFFNDPKPCVPADLPKYEASHEFQTKKRRQDARAKVEAEAAAKRAHTEAAVLAAGGAPLGGARGMHPYQQPVQHHYAPHVGGSFPGATGYRPPQGPGAAPRGAPHAPLPHAPQGADAAARAAAAAQQQQRPGPGQPPPRHGYTLPR